MAIRRCNTGRRSSAGSFSDRRRLSLVPAWLLLCLLPCSMQADAQQQELNVVASEIGHRSEQLPIFFDKGVTKGSPLLSGTWLKGRVELTDHQILPEPGFSFHFNYDKFRNRLMVTIDGIIAWSYPANSVSSFLLVDSSITYDFERIPWISKTLLLQPILRSEKGYSLYRRVITKFIGADFKENGYYSTGRKFDEYVDFYEYYLIYPGKTSFKKFYLKEAAVRSALKGESTQLDAFFSQTNSPLDERSLVSLFQYLNDRKDR